MSQFSQTYIAGQDGQARATRWLGRQTEAALSDVDLLYHAAVHESLYADISSTKTLLGLSVEKPPQGYQSFAQANLNIYWTAGVRLDALCKLEAGTHTIASAWCFLDSSAGSYNCNLAALHNHGERQYFRLTLENNSGRLAVDVENLSLDVQHVVPRIQSPPPATAFSTALQGGVILPGLEVAGEAYFIRTTHLVGAGITFGGLAVTAGSLHTGRKLITGAGVTLGGLEAAGDADRPNRYHRTGGGISFAALDATGPVDLTARQWINEATPSFRALGVAGVAYRSFTTQTYDAPGGPSIPALTVAGGATWVPVSTGDYYVSPTGDDANSGTAQGDAFRTIQHGADVATSGQTVVVLPGTYNESVDLLGNDGVKLLGSGWPKVVATANWTIYATAATDDIWLEGLDLSGGTAGVYCEYGTAWTMKGLRVHDTDRYGIHPHRATSPTIRDCRVWSLLDNDEAMGIRTERCISAEVFGNATHHIWKNGIREIRSQHSKYYDNTIFGCYTGFALNYSATDCLFENNYIHHCTHGAALKHANGTNQPYVGDNIYRYNDHYMNTFNDVSVGINASAVDHLYVERNYFREAGDAAILIDTAHTLSDITIDENLYRKTGARPWFHYTNQSGSEDCTAVSQIQSLTPFENNGIEWAGSKTGYGASGLAAVSPEWVGPSMPIHNQTSGSAEYLTDLRWGEPNDDYWETDTAANEWASFDLGSAEELSWCMLQAKGTGSDCPRDWRLQTSDDGTTWTTRGSYRGDQDYILQWQKIDPVVTARYVRLYVDDNYGAADIKVREFMVGRLS